jgi:hypothetical protein
VCEFWEFGWKKRWAGGGSRKNKRQRLLSPLSLSLTISTPECETATAAAMTPPVMEPSARSTPVREARPMTGALTSTHVMAPHCVYAL